MVGQNAKDFYFLLLRVLSFLLRPVYRRHIAEDFGGMSANCISEVAGTILPDLLMGTVTSAGK
jgi:hypothetical protein